MRKKKQQAHGGARQRAGRPPKADKNDWVSVSCVLRKDTVERLRDYGERRLFGPYLQWVLDRYPLPSTEEYEAAVKGKDLLVTLPNRRKVPMIISRVRTPRKKRALDPELQKALDAYDAIGNGN